MLENKEGVFIKIKDEITVNKVSKDNGISRTTMITVKKSTFAL